MDEECGSLPLDENQREFLCVDKRGEIKVVKGEEMRRGRWRGKENREREKGREKERDIKAIVMDQLRKVAFSKVREEKTKSIFGRLLLAGFWRGREKIKMKYTEVGNKD